VRSKPINLVHSPVCNAVSYFTGKPVLIKLLAKALLLKSGVPLKAVLIILVFI